MKPVNKLIMICTLWCVQGLYATGLPGGRDQLDGSISAPFRITHGPYVQQITATSATIIWCTDYRYSVPTVYWGRDSTLAFATTPVSDGLVNVNLELARVTLNDLQPATTYYYSAASKKIASWAYMSITYGAVASSGIQQFTTLNEQKAETSFLVVNDLAGNISMMDSLLAGRVTDAIDGIFLNGNMLIEVTDQQTIFEGVVDPCCRLFADRLPFHLVRGVQECRGAFNRRLPDYLGCNDFSYYYAFTQGPVRFIVLDSGEDAEDASPQYAGMNLFEEYREQQKAWLEKEIGSEEFAAAQYHLVFCHLPIYGGQNHFGEQDIRHEWGDILNRAKIDLFVAGHADRYQRISAEAGQNQYPLVISAGANAGFATVLRIDASRDHMTLTAMHHDGSIVDRYTLQSTGVANNASPANPAEVVLRQNYPNPFNSSTCLTFSLPQKCRVTLKLFNMLGQEVRTLLNSYHNPGVYDISLDSRELTTGVYYAVLQADQVVQSRKIVYIQ